MCGICGFAGYGTKDDLKRMNERLAHRGPDARGLWYNKSAGLYLGHRRLSIIDIKGGAQPMWSRDRTLCIVFNGEIYNFRELRETLEKAGHRFSSDHSDTEVLLYGYREWGDSLPEKLNGMWAFAIYDKKNRRLFLSRDRFGKKPLYYTKTADTFIFSSELSSLRAHPLCTTSVSPFSLKKYFAYNYIPAPRTLYKNIYKLPGGCNLTCTLPDNTVRIQRYWQFHLEPFSTIPRNAEERWCEELREHIATAVKRRLVSDVPLGIFLSGGVDSTAVATFAARHVPPERLKTFSIGFDEPSFDESYWSEMASESLGSDHYHSMLSLDNAAALLPEITSMIDEPFGDSSLLPTYLLCRECRTQVTVALGGDGADELFAGYDPLLALAAARLYSRLIPRPIHEGIRMLIGRLPVSHANMSTDFRLKRTFRGLSYPPPFWNPVWQASLDPREINDLFLDKTPIEDLYSEAIECWEQSSCTSLVDKTLEYFTRLYLSNDILTKVDRAGMMNSLEVRAPFLDIDLVDFVRRIPTSFKFRKGTTKYILKKALEPILPRAILNRSKKGFGVPVGKWFRSGALSINTAECNPLLDRSFIHEQISAHRENRRDNRAFLWNLWLLNSYAGRTSDR